MARAESSLGGRDRARRRGAGRDACAGRRRARLRRARRGQDDVRARRRARARRDRAGDEPDLRGRSASTTARRAGRAPRPLPARRASTTRTRGCWTRTSGRTLITFVEWPEQAGDDALLAGERRSRTASRLAHAGGDRRPVEVDVMSSLGLDTATPSTVVGVLGADGSPRRAPRRPAARRAPGARGAAAASWPKRRWRTPGVGWDDVDAAGGRGRAGRASPACASGSPPRVRWRRRAASRSWPRGLAARRWRRGARDGARRPGRSPSSTPAAVRRSPPPATRPARLLAPAALAPRGPRRGGSRACRSRRWRSGDGAVRFREQPRGGRSGRSRPTRTPSTASAPSRSAGSERPGEPDRPRRAPTRLPARARRRRRR